MTPSPTAAVWLRSPLGEASPDGPVVGGVVNETPAVVHGSGAGQLTSWTWSDDRFIRHDTAIATTGTVFVFDIDMFQGSAVLVGTDLQRRRPLVWMSSDAVAWTQVDTTGLADQAEMGVLATSSGTLYAAGGFREGNTPAVQAAMWRSTDGHSWETVTAPDLRTNSIVRDIVAGDDSIIAATIAMGAGAIWRSIDGGATWLASTVSAESSHWTVDSIARTRDRMVAVGMAQTDQGLAALVLVSTDDGVSWMRPSPVSAIPKGEFFDARVVATDEAFWMSGSEHNDGFSNPEPCYRDLLSCQDGSRSVLLRSTDGLEWEEIDLATLGQFGLERLVDLGDHGLMLIGRAGPTLETWTWPTDTVPPLRAPPPPPADGEPPMIAGGARLSAGTPYRYPLYIHCGMGILGNFNDQWWVLAPGSTAWNPEMGVGEAPPAEWPIAQQFVFGIITPVDANKIEYSIPSGEVIAIYEPAKTDPQLCA